MGLKSFLKDSLPSKPKSTSSSTAPPHGEIYWQPRFDPSIPIDQEWEQKEGRGPNGDGWGNQELQSYTRDRGNAWHTADGKLIIRAIHSPHLTPTHTSSRLVSHHPLTHPSGHLHSLLTLPSAAGIWPAFWLLPSEPFSWPDEGEIDIAETWNAREVTHACLHWGRYDGVDWDKHRTRGVKVEGMGRVGRKVAFDFMWDQNQAPTKQSTGRAVWLVDGKAVMKADLVPGMRPLADWKILLNIAMGGGPLEGKVPDPGEWDMIVHEMWMARLGEGVLERYWREAPLGKTY